MIKSSQGRCGPGRWKRGGRGSCTVAGQAAESGELLLAEVQASPTMLSTVSLSAKKQLDDKWAAAFYECGIPFEVASSEAFRDAVEDMARLVRMPDDRIALVLTVWVQRANTGRDSAVFSTMCKLKAKYGGRICVSACAAHTLGLLLEGIGKIRRFANVVAKLRVIAKVIMNQAELRAEYKQGREWW